MDTKYIITQAVGIIAMFFSVFSFQMNKHKQIMLMQMAAGAFFAAQYFLLGAYTGMVVNAIAIIRDIIFYFRDRKWVQSKLWIIGFCILFAVSGIFTWTGLHSLFMTAAMVLNTISFSITKPKLVRTTILISSPLVLVYCIITGSIGGIINEILVEISSIVGLLRYDLKKKEK